MHIPHELTVTITKLLHERSKYHLYHSSKLFFILRYYNHVCCIDSFDVHSKFNCFTFLNINPTHNFNQYNIQTKHLKIYDGILQYDIPKTIQTITQGSFNPEIPNMNKFSSIRKLIILVYISKIVFSCQDNELNNVEVLKFIVSPRAQNEILNLKITKLPKNLKKLFFQQKYIDSIDSQYTRYGDVIRIYELPKSLYHITSLHFPSVNSCLLKQNMSRRITSLILWNYSRRSITNKEISHLPSKLLFLKIGALFENEITELPDTIQNLILRSNTHIRCLPRHIKKLFIDYMGDHLNVHIPKTIQLLAVYIETEINKKYLPQIHKLIVRYHNNITEFKNIHLLTSLKQVKLLTPTFPNTSIFDISKLDKYELLIRETDDHPTPWMYPYILDLQKEEIKYLCFKNNKLTTLHTPVRYQYEQSITFLPTLQTIFIQSAENNTYQFPDSLKNLLFNSILPQPREDMSINILNIPKTLQMFSFHSTIHHLLVFDPHFLNLQFVKGNKLIRARKIVFDKIY